MRPREGGPTLEGLMGHDEGNIFLNRIFSNIGNHWIVFKRRMS